MPMLAFRVLNSAVFVLPMGMGFLGNVSKNRRKGEERRE